MDFSHWNMASDFSIFEIACLACGIEPASTVSDVRVDSIVRLLNEAYERSYNNAWWILRQNELDRINGREETTPRYFADALEMCMGLPSRDLRLTFSEALQDSENKCLVSLDEDRKRFGRDDIEVFFKDCEFEPNVLLYKAIQRSSTLKACSVEGDKESRAADLSLATRERNSLLTIIAVLCKESKIDYSKAAKAAGLIKDMAARLGLEIGETTIEQHLKEFQAHWKPA